MTFLPMWASACPSPTVVVVFPSPAGVGEIAVTRMSFPSGCSCTRFVKARDTFALYGPYCSSSSGRMPIFSAISWMGFNSAFCAISISLSIVSSLSTAIFSPYAFVFLIIS